MNLERDSGHIPCWDYSMTCYMAQVYSVVHFSDGKTEALFQKLGRSKPKARQLGASGGLQRVQAGSLDLLTKILKRCGST